MTGHLSKLDNAQSGNVLFYILLAVALLASLSFAVSNSGRGKAELISEERARLIASDILDYSNTLSSAVTQLRLRGCADTQISFQNSATTQDYTNTGNPTGDTICHVFNLNGGAANYKDAQETAFANSTPYEWDFIGSNEIENIGTTCGANACADLIVRLRNVREEVCIEINNKLSIGPANSAPPTDSDLNATPFIGTYIYQESIADEAGGSDAAGQSAACIQETTLSEYMFYAVLSSR